MPRTTTFPPPSLQFTLLLSFSSPTPSVAVTPLSISSAIKAGAREYYSTHDSFNCCSTDIVVGVLALVILGQKVPLVHKDPATRKKDAISVSTALYLDCTTYNPNLTLFAMLC